MEEQYQLLSEIIFNNQKWKAKVIVVEKQSPKPSRQGNGRYQHLMLMDTQGSTIQASLYDSNITAFEDQLVLGKTYTISKAYVKNNMTNYRYSTGSLQWTISGETRIEELNEDNLEFVFSTYQLTQFHELEQYMDTDADLNILAVAVDMTPKRLIQSKDGNQIWLQDIILLDMNFKTMVLTLWNSFVDRECLLIANIIDKKPVIFTTRLKITSLFGLKLSMKVHSTFFINTPFNSVKQMTEWIRTNFIKIDDFVFKKSYMNKSPTNLSPPVRSKFTPIQNLQERLLTRQFYWVNGTATTDKIDSKSWTRAYVQLSDVTGSISANAIGEPVEKLLFTTSESLMEETKFGSKTNFEATIKKMQDTERAFYSKALQNEPNSSSYKFDIIFVTDFDHPSPGQEI
ncbi:replication protein A 70 kDa DNA-binding subunit D-like [Olea europaea var. sylvestris]|uniref:replication protein A 70 kDa DNA-binding subunit D-like n=1 Tax=Olea europaea var. sylvestris TaxID=158386 RepID=UPI000C1D5916|nr:replication protein A 70 kDa DNA-binding subunit D-like [Olea europaea var. sylvestris]